MHPATHLTFDQNIDDTACKETFRLSQSYAWEIPALGISKTDSPMRPPCKKFCRHTSRSHNSGAAALSMALLVSEILDHTPIITSQPTGFGSAPCENFTFSVRSATFDQLYMSLSSSLNRLGSTSSNRIMCIALESAITRSEPLEYEPFIISTFSFFLWHTYRPLQAWHSLSCGSARLLVHLPLLCSPQKD